MESGVDFWRCAYRGRACNDKQVIILKVDGKKIIELLNDVINDGIICGDIWKELDKRIKEFKNGRDTK